MDRERFEGIMTGEIDVGTHEQNEALLGLNIIARYLPKRGVEAADHEIILAADVDELLAAGISEEDALKLRKLGWMIHNDECLACHV